jgi:hypothetical protein
MFQNRNHFITQRRKDAKMKENEIGKWVVDAAVKVHRELGPGLLETVDEESLAQALERPRRRVPLFHPCLGDSVREEVIAPGAAGNACSPCASAERWAARPSRAQQETWLWKDCR